MKNKMEKSSLLAALAGSTILLTMFSGCATKYSMRDVSPQALLYRGDKAFEEHRFNEAIYNYNEIISRYRNFEKADLALYRLAYAYLVLDQFENAKKSFDLICSNYPQSKYIDDVKLWLKVLNMKTANNKQKQKQSSKSLTEEEIEELRKENQSLKKQVERLKKIIEE